MHKRLRPEWPCLVFKYWARPLVSFDSKENQWLWDTAKEMQYVWNALIDLREQCFTEVQPLEAEAKKARWARLNRDNRALLAESTLNWECQGEILDRLLTASRAAVKKGVKLRKQYRLERINIPHRFTGGGLPVAKLFTDSPRTSRIRIYPATSFVPQTATETHDEATQNGRYRKGHFGLNDQSFPFAVLMHRDIPPDAIAKKVVWCGVYQPHYPRHEVAPMKRPQDQPWQWSLQIVCEVPPPKIQREDIQSIGLDLGWRIMAEGTYLRIGMLADTNGKMLELRLPLLGTDTNHTRRCQLLQRDQTWYDLLELDRKIGDSVEDCKGPLRQLFPTLPAGFVQMRQGGLRKLLRTLDDLGIENQQQRATICSILEAWDLRERELQRYKANLFHRLLGRKRWLYQNLASWLTKTYRTITWEGDLSLKEMAEDPNLTGALANAAKYRQWAALGELRGYLKKAAMKNGCTLIDAPAAGSTIFHWRTGEKATKKGASLLLEFPDGEKLDQDENAAKNLLNYGFSQTSGDLQQHQGLRNMGKQKAEQRLDIPQQLRSVAIPCSL